VSNLEFRNASRKFCVVKSCRRTSLTANANLDARCETSLAKLLTRLGINQVGVSCALSGISEIDCRLIDIRGAGRKPQVRFRWRAEYERWQQSAETVENDSKRPFVGLCLRRDAAANPPRSGSQPIGRMLPADCHAAKPLFLSCAQLFSEFANGKMRMRLPVALNIALATAGPIGGTPGSPTPVGGTEDLTM
jgi:hypothetical protein